MAYFTKDVPNQHPIQVNLPYVAHLGMFWADKYGSLFQDDTWSPHSTSLGAVDHWTAVAKTDRGNGFHNTSNPHSARTRETPCLMGLPHQWCFRDRWRPCDPCRLLDAAKRWEMPMPKRKQRLLALWACGCRVTWLRNCTWLQLKTLVLPIVPYPKIADLWIFIPPIIIINYGFL